MRYFRFVIGAIRMLFYSIVSFDRIKFIFPVKLEDGAKFSLRKNGKINMGKHVSISHNARLSVTENAYLSIGN